MSAVPRKGFVALFKRGWNEIPDVMSSSIMAIIGTGIGIFGLTYYFANDGDNRKYREDYTVFRHDDPRAAKLRKYDD